MELAELAVELAVELAELAMEPANLRTCEPANLRTGSGTCELAVELAVEPANWALACLVELALELQGHPPLFRRVRV